MVSLGICESLDELEGMHEAYLCSLRGPQEAWLEEQAHVRNTEIHAFTHDGRRIGYCCTDPSKHLLFQFYVAEEYSRLAVEAFEAVLTQAQLTRAYVTTRDPLALSLCLTFHKAIALESFLFEHRFVTDVQLRDLPAPEFGPAGDSDAASIIEASGDFYGDVAAEIKAGRLYVLTAADDMLAIGYLSARFCAANTANLGMFTNPKFRRRGAGAYILQKLAEDCRANGLSPIAACYHENPESKRTLEKAGFVSCDRTFLVSF